MTPKKSRIDKARSSLWGRTLPFLVDGWEAQESEANSAVKHADGMSPGPSEGEKQTTRTVV